MTSDRPVKRQLFSRPTLSKGRNSLKIIGLTGSIGMGKSETSKMFKRLGVPVFDADAHAHKLMAKGGAAVAAIVESFPDVIKEDAIDRQALGAQVFGRPDALRRLENIVHPYVARARRDFLRRMQRRGYDMVVLDVPLLFETHNDRFCDYIVVVSAPAFLQKQRVMARPHMTEKKFNAILAQQLPDVGKRRRADFIVPTGQGKRVALNHVKKVIAELRSAKSRSVRRTYH
ncbi:MAG: dephospho-CoA kinase [Kordiimonas sp.]|nr:dephospho-CoA kinase [Kordiimonas sp.]|tara:strand:- start:374 stop:1063 length:690 start_codon:yes stop_codon:yes gene_type:complete